MHQLRNFLTTLKRFSVSSLLNIIGLAVAFATAYLILVQVHYDFTYNKTLPDSDRVFVLQSESGYNPGKYQSWLSRPISEMSCKDNPVVEKYGIMPPLDANYNNVVVKKGEQLDNTQTLYASRATTGGLEVFNVKAVKGDLSRFSEPNAIILSESSAARLGVGINDQISFGSEWNPNNNSTIVAIYSDFPANSDYKYFEAIYDYGDDYLNDYDEWSFQYLVKLYSPEDVEKFMDYAADRYLEINRAMGDGDIQDKTDEEVLQEVRSKMRLLPITDTYFATDSETGMRGNKTTSITLLAIAILVIVIAFINFVNFFMAMVPQRLRGVNTYRVYGCSLGQMRRNFIFESIGLTALALCLMVICILLLKGTSISEYISTSILLKDNLGIFISILISGIVFALIAGIYPAYYITSFPLALATKGSFGASKSGKRLRYALVGIQFIISISLIICSLFINIQHKYMMKYNMGFNKDMLLTGGVTSNIGKDFKNRETFASELKKNTQIVDVTYANGKIVSPERMGWGRNFKDQNINFQCYPVAYNFLTFMNIDIVEGNNFSLVDELDTMGVFIFNESARDEFNITLEDKIYGHCGETHIAGFCKNFNYRPLQYESGPFAFYVFGPNSWKTLNHLYVRTTPDADIDKVIDFIKDEVIKYSPTIERSHLDFYFFDEELGKQYYEEKKLTNLISIFSLISIIISLMGVFGLVLFETQYSRKEIAIRRVNGASIAEILKIFNIHFVRIILICFVISVPICYFIIDKWLSNFAYRTPIHWWVFAIALIIVMAVTIGIVIVRSWKSANANPVKSLKAE